jgi:hypothetical protein
MKRKNASGDAFIYQLILSYARPGIAPEIRKQAAKATMA